jgi:Mrp family chromosome partitioning ATPase
MTSVLRELSERFETVVIDTPPLLAVSDALPLVAKASGVVVVARIDHTMRGALSRAVQILKGAGANVLGPVATGASTHPRAVESVAAYAPEPEPALHSPGG